MMASGETWAIVQDDCRSYMATMADCSIDSIVTDPPYELSNDRKASAARVLSEVVFPKNAVADPGIAGVSALCALALKVSGLCGSWFEPGPSPTVPIGAVELDNEPLLRKVEIEDVKEAARVIAHNGLGDDLDADGAEHLGGFAFYLGNAKAGIDAMRRAQACFASGGFGVRLGFATARLPCLAGSGAAVELSDDVVRLLNDAAARLVGAGSGTEDEAMTRFDLAGRPAEPLAARSAFNLLLLALSFGAKLVGTGAGTGGLSAMLEPSRVRVIGGAANRALSFNLLTHKGKIAGKGFMGKAWDGSKIAFDVDMWRECLRVLKPGGHLITFGGQRTIHRIICAAEDAGFDVRDLGAWQYWSGFPKSLDVSKAIDAAAGAEREVVGMKRHARDGDVSAQRWASCGAHHVAVTGGTSQVGLETLPATDDAKTWQGWGTALKPCLEPWALLRKPFKGTVAANVLEWGTGGINVDGCRYAYGDRAWPGPNEEHAGWATTRKNGLLYGQANTETNPPSDLGRWPANVYVCPKPSTAEREIGCGHLPQKRGAELVGRNAENKGVNSPRAGAGRTSNGRGNTHPTVKPIALMQWLCRLVTPPGGTVLDPFAGSGTTGIAAMREGFGFVGIEMDAAHCEIARCRIRGDAPLLNTMREDHGAALPW